MLIETEGIILKTVKILGGKKLLTVLTKNHGKIIFDIRDSKSKKDNIPTLSVLMLLQLNLIKNKEKFKLDSFEILKSSYDLVKNYDIYNELSDWAIFINKIIPSDARADNIFEIFKKLLYHIDTSDISVKTLILSAYFKVVFQEGLISDKENFFQKFKEKDQKIINFFIRENFDNIKKYKLSELRIKEFKNYISKFTV